MRKLLYILRKEFLQTFRDKMMLQIIFFVPILQLLILPWAADMDVRHLKISIVDSDMSSYSRELTSKISASETFELYSTHATYQESMRELDDEQVDLIITIPNGFEKNLVKERETDIAITADAINGIKAGLGTSYVQEIIRDFNNDIRIKWIPEFEDQQSSPINVKITTWFNKNLDFRTFMVPAILVFLVTVTGLSLSALNIVKEKEIGTIEQLNVSPMTRYHFILGKLIPFWLISVFIFSFGLLILRYIYGIPIYGNIGLLYLATMIYLISILGLGLLISTFSATQQQSMFITFFFLMIFILMSGLFTVVESMPLWGRLIAEGIPITHYMTIVRAVVIKGSGFMHVATELLYLVVFAIVVNIIAVLTYRKTS